jgi:DNA repair protein RadC
MKVKSENEAVYNAKITSKPTREDVIIAHALDILQSRLVSRDFKIEGPDDAKNFVKLKLATLEHEIFSIMFLDSQHQLIAYDEMFRGTVSQTSVYPREVAKRALELNSSAVILCHNHPSGVPTPSRADENLTRTLKSALELIDVRVLDHFIVGGSKVVSMAELGLI